MILFGVFDTQGNELKMTDNGMFLKLKDENKERKIFEPFDNQTVYKFVKEKNIMNAINGVGYNYEALKLLKKHGYNYLRVQVENETFQREYMIDEIIRDGTFLWFKTEGFEKQIFMELK